MPSFSDCKSGHAWLICQRKAVMNARLQEAPVHNARHTGIQTQPNPPHLRWLNAGSLSSEHEVSCQVHALPSRISYRLNCTSSGDNRKVCRGAPVSVVKPLPGAFPREAHRRKKTLVELGDIISAFIFCPNHYSRKQQSRTPPAFLLNVSLGPCAGASSWSWLANVNRLGGQESWNGHFRHSFISWCCKLLRQRCKTVF